MEWIESHWTGGDGTVPLPSTHACYHEACYQYCCLGHIQVNCCFYCYSPTHWDYCSTDLTNFSLLFIFSNHFRLWTMRRFPMGTRLSHALHYFTNMCLPHGKPCFIKPNFIPDSSFPCCAWLCRHTHMCITHVLCSSSILPLPYSCIMPLISIMPALDSISRSNTNMYIQYDSIYVKARESTGIPSLILLEFHL